jgi:hypothetical protein
MTFAERRSGSAATSRLAYRVGRWFLAVVRTLVLIILVAWATLAIHYSNLPWPWLRVVLAAMVLVFSIWALWLTRRPHMSWAFAGLFAVVAVGFTLIQPSHDRPWRPEVAVMPRAIIDGDRVRFTGFLQRINQLADHPEFYHLLSNSCTINIIRYANAVGRRGGFDFRHFLNGFIDGYLFASGRLNSTLPFDELRRRSWINDAARSAGNAEDFSERIRASLPTVRP